jgi:hypothetical protein
MFRDDDMNLTMCLHMAGSGSFTHSRGT